MTDKEIQLAKDISTPDGYAEKRLGIKLHPIQREVLKSLFSKTKSKVSMRCGNEVGKTKVVCVSSILYALEILGAKCVSTSATHRQVIKQLIPYLKEHSSKYGSNWEWLDNQIKINGEMRYIGYSTSDDSKWQGWHETVEYPLLIIVDEAAGVADEIFQSIGRCNPTWLLVCGSPIGPEGVWFSIEREESMYKQFSHFHLPKYSCCKPDWWLEKKDIDDFVAMWGIEHPLIISSVYGEFATQVEGGVITLADIERCIREPMITSDYNTGGKHVAIDFAAGGDSNVIVFRNGNTVSIIKEWKERDTMKTARDMVEILCDRISKGIQPSMVSGDADGLGLPIIHRIKELGWPVNEFHGGAASTDKMCKNYITDCWINACKKIRNRSIIIPDNQELKLQLTDRKSFQNQTGKLQ